MVEEYPRNLMELEAMFSTEEACRQYLARLRWPKGFCCPRCGEISDRGQFEKFYFGVQPVDIRLR